MTFIYINVHNYALFVHVRAQLKADLFNYQKLNIFTQIKFAFLCRKWLQKFVLFTFLE